MPIRGNLTFPGDKSISHRALMIGALTDGPCKITNLSTGLDVQSTRQCLEDCGITIETFPEYTVVHGGEFKNPTYDLDCNNSGTTVRLLSGLLTGRGIRANLVGDISLSNRPMNRIVNPLRSMGADIKANIGKLPLELYPNQLQGIQYSMPIPSAQVKSAIIFAALGASSPTIIHEPVPSRDHTERMLQSLGASIHNENGSISINPSKNKLPSFDLNVPGDPSTAAFFATAAAIVPDSEIILKDISRNLTRIGFYKVLEMMGGKIEYMDEKIENGESSGTVIIRKTELHGVTIDGEMIPSLIDEIPLIAILATQAEGTTIIKDAGDLRFKESDRIHAIVTNLNRMGAIITEHENGFAITGRTKLKGCNIQTFGDHRIAMAFTIAGLISDGEVTVDDSNCVNISFPEFHTKLREVVQ
ncbi:MAG: 3-phosphoshikimate 1-carboxyvinyltransferase [Candidatus Marinimicrobia bacterium]|nr:3-phosphoshikimate 1-carboxyvinyltransferase [Candidatus Neomarinimicrobiota bacterium]